MKIAPLLFLGLAACSADTFVSADAGDAATTDAAVVDGAQPCSSTQTLCGGACVDTSSDTHHCGDCKTSCTELDAGTAACTGGTCVYPMTDQACVTANGTEVFWTNGRGSEAGGVYRVAPGPDGGAPKLIAGGQTIPHGVFADDKQVYWTDVGVGANDGSVQRAGVDGTNVALVADASSHAVTPGPVIAAQGTVYWGNGDNSIWSAPTTGGVPTYVYAAASPPLFFVVTTKALYWTANPSNTTSTPTLGQYKFGAPAGADVYAGQPGQTFGGLWVSASDDNAVCVARSAQQNVSCGLLTVTGPTNAIATNTPAFGLTATGDEEAIYWTERVANGGIRKFDGNGNLVSTIANDDTPTCVAIDGKYVYWTARGRLTPGVATR